MSRAARVQPMSKQGMHAKQTTKLPLGRELSAAHTNTTQLSDWRSQNAAAHPKETRSCTIRGYTDIQVPPSFPTPIDGHSVWNSRIIRFANNSPLFL